MFSPITERSLKIRLLYFAIYAVLVAGGLTMVLPFQIMVSGSIEPRANARASLIPTYLFSEKELWSRFLETRYGDVPNDLRAAWDSPSADFQSKPGTHGSREVVALWERFLLETKPRVELFGLAFLRGPRMPSPTGRDFRIWLLRQFGGSLEEANNALKTHFSKPTAITPPTIDLAGPALRSTPLVKKFYEYLALQPKDMLVPLNVGGYFRAVFLPRIHGGIESYNAKYGTSYSSFEEVPFGSRAPQNGLGDWLLFVSKILRPDFVVLTEAGRERASAFQVSKDEFIRTLAKPEELCVVSVDTLFQSWALESGHGDVRIPQAALDEIAFQKSKWVWTRHFLTMNYLHVFDEILLHGRAISNTLVLVLLCVGGALIVNPLAAYALSRFKLRQGYMILVFCLATIAFPAEVTMIPVFLQMREFHLLNTFGALVLPGLANGFSIFLLKGFFDSLPKELYEAAEIDGASEWTMFWQITMSLSRPILAVIALGAFSSAYGTFFYALILAPDPKIWTIMVYIYELRMTVDAPVVYASLILTALPTLLVFVFCQNVILRGIVVPSEK